MESFGGQWSVTYEEKPLPDAITSRRKISPTKMRKDMMTNTRHGQTWTHRLGSGFVFQGARKRILMCFSSETYSTWGVLPCAKFKKKKRILQDWLTRFAGSTLGSVERFQNFQMPMFTSGYAKAVRRSCPGRCLTQGRELLDFKAVHLDTPHHPATRLRSNQHVFLDISHLPS